MKLYITISASHYCISIFHLRALSVARCCVLNRFLCLYIQTQTIIQLNEIMIIMAAMVPITTLTFRGVPEMKVQEQDCYNESTAGADASVEVSSYSSNS